VAQDSKRLQAVPPFLADTLRAESEWEIDAAGIERALVRARQIRLEMNAKAPDTGAAPPPPDAR
jgi:hypothetical protein